MDNWRLVREAGVKDRDKWLHPIVFVACNYLFLPLIPAFGAKIHNSSYPISHDISHSATNLWIFYDWIICQGLRIEVLCVSHKIYPDSKVHGANMGPTWVLSAQDGPHVGPWTLLSGYIDYAMAASGSYSRKTGIFRNAFINTSAFCMSNDKRNSILGTFRFTLFPRIIYVWNNTQLVIYWQE